MIKNASEARGTGGGMAERGKRGRAARRGHGEGMARKRGGREGSSREGMAGERFLFIMCYEEKMKG